ncbi:17667_t:CDS:2, partial [Racocetra persica]
LPRNNSRDIYGITPEQKPFHQSEYFNCENHREHSRTRPRTIYIEVTLKFWLK